MTGHEKKLQELINEYGIERVLTWCETRLKQWKRTQDPEFKTHQSQRVKDKRQAEKKELTELRAQVAALNTSNPQPTKAEIGASPTPFTGKTKGH